MASGPGAQLELDKSDEVPQHVNLKALEQSLPPDAHVQFEDFDKQYEKKLIRKLDRLIMPASCILYLFSSLDKGNLGNAKTLGMVGPSPGLGADPSGKRFALLNAFYFIGYVTWMIPTTLFAKRTKANIVIGCSGIYWGIAAAATSAVKTYGQGGAARYFVGAGEAGFGPVIPFFLARWYTKRDLALRMSAFLCSGPVSGVINGLVAYGCSFINGRLAPWRYLFIIEGCPAVLAGAFALWILPGEILTTKRLDDKQRACVIARKSREQSTESHKINWKHALSILWSWQILLPAMCYQVVILVGAALGAFLPTLVQDAGYEGAIAQVYTLPPYGCAAVVMLIVCWVSDRYRKRGPGMILGFTSMLLGFSMLLGSSPHQPHVRYAALVFCEVGQFICIPLNLTWVAENSGNESRRAVAIPFTISVSQALAIASGYMFPAKDKPNYTSGSAICTALTGYGIIVSIAYIWLLDRENKRRDRIEGDTRGQIPDTATYADKAKYFRYIW